MNFKTTYILFGVLMGTMGLFLLSQMFGKKSKEEHTYVLPSLHDVVKPVKADAIDRVQIERFGPQAETLLFYRNEQGDWRLKQPGVRAENNLVTRIIDQVLGARMEEQVDLTSDLKQFGLDSPSAVVTLYQKGSDRDWKLNLGAGSAGDEKGVVYVTSSDQPKEPMAVKRSTLDSLFKKVNDFRSKHLLAESSFDIASAKLQEPKHETVELEKSSDGKWRFNKPAFGEADSEGETSAPPGNTEKKITGVRDLLQTIVDVRVESDEDFGATSAADADLAAKGLEKGKEILRIEVKRQPSSFGSEEKKPAIQDALLIGNKADDKGEKL